MKRHKILIDTDPGDDIDDALALAYVVSKDCFDLVGVTTVFGETEKRARIVKKLCALKGASVPVFYGYGLPLVGYMPEHQPINQYTADPENGAYAPDNRNGEEDAVDFIVSACRKYGEELTVIGIGPLTNLARAIEKDPAALNGVKATVIMGGDFVRDFPEWNLFCDPKAAQTVFERAKDLSAVGVEITSRAQLTEEQSAAIEHANGSEFFRYVGELVRMWRQSHGGALPVLHDVLAVTSVNERFCDFAEGKFSVNPEGVLRAGSGRCVRYAAAFDKDAFMREFLSVWGV